MAARKLRRVTVLHGEQGFVIEQQNVLPADEEEFVAGMLAEYDDAIITATDVYVAKPRRHKPS